MMVSTDRTPAFDNQEEKHPTISRCAHTKKSASKSEGAIL